MRLLAAAAVLAVALSVVCAAPDPRIKHVVVVMMENRAFDHMVGFLKRVNPEINGLNGDESNPRNASDPNSPVITVNDQGAYVDPDPGHSIPDTTQQVFGTDQRSVASMNGFVENAGKHFSDVEVVMSCFDQQSVPVISTLALEFALFDQWHASIPGPTMPNRAYVGSATSHGAGDNNVLDIALGYPQKTLFQSLNDSGHSWNIYFEEIPTMLQFKDTRHPSYLEHNYFGLKAFADHCQAGTLPDYSFVEPIYFDVPGIFSPATDQHPSHDVSAGEKFMKYVYESLRNSTSWNETLLIITYDEHGGFYDHFPTPLTGIPNPDGLNTTGKDPFDFTRLGVRVPTVMISPYIDAGTVVHDPPAANKPFPSSLYDHSSVPATVKALFDMPAFLTKRDEWAGTFTHILTRETPRTDCPMVLPDPPQESAAHAAYRAAMRARANTADGTLPINEFQRELVGLALGLVGEQPLAADVEMTEAAASHLIRAKMAQLLGRETEPFRM